MIKPKIASNAQLKEKQFVEFAKLLREQIAYGSKKYTGSDEKEATDIICDAFGADYMLMNMMKYVLRFKNLQRERDLLKIATYSYLLWLAMGYHLEKEHDEDTEKTES